MHPQSIRYNLLLHSKRTERPSGDSKGLFCGVRTPSEWFGCYSGTAPIHSLRCVLNDEAVNWGFHLTAAEPSGSDLHAPCTRRPNSAKQPPDLPRAVLSQSRLGHPDPRAPGIPQSIRCGDAPVDGASRNPKALSPAGGALLPAPRCRPGRIPVGRRPTG